MTGFAGNTGYPGPQVVFASTPLFSWSPVASESEYLDPTRHPIVSSVSLGHNPMSIAPVFGQPLLEETARAPESKDGTAPYLSWAPLCHGTTSSRKPSFDYWNLGTNGPIQTLPDSSRLFQPFSRVFSNSGCLEPFQTPVPSSQYNVVDADSIVAEFGKSDLGSSAPACHIFHRRKCKTRTDSKSITCEVPELSGKLRCAPRSRSQKNSELVFLSPFCDSGDRLAEKSFPVYNISFHHLRLEEPLLSVNPNMVHAPPNKSVERGRPDSPDFNDLGNYTWTIECSRAVPIMKVKPKLVEIPPRKGHIYGQSVPQPQPGKSSGNLKGSTTVSLSKDFGEVAESLKLQAHKPRIFQSGLQAAIYATLYPERTRKLQESLDFDDGVEVNESIDVSVHLYDRWTFETGKVGTLSVID